MLKVLIVDDELLIRVGIKSLIDWEKHGFQIIGDACDGDMALKIIEKTLPDIILTDIIMPGMNGIKLIEAVKKRYPFIRILVLSCHNDYQYVRQAMKLGAEDYILKLSMKPEEMLTHLQEVAVKIKNTEEEFKSQLGRKSESAVSDNQQKGQLFSMLVDSRDKNPALEKAFNELQLSHYKDNLVFICTRIARYNKLVIEKNLMERSLLNFIDQQSRQSYTGETFKHKDNEFGTIIGLGNGNKEEICAEVKDFCHDLVIAAKRFLNISIKIGISLPFTGCFSIRNGYLQACDALQYAFYDEERHVYLYDQSFLIHTRAEILKKADLEDIHHIIEAGNIDRINEKISEMFSSLEEARMSIELTTEVFLEILHSFKIAMKNYQIDIGDLDKGDSPLYQQVLAMESIDEAKSWFMSLAANLCSCISKVRQKKHREEISKLLDYIKDHYFEDITLKWAAEYVHMSESHLSRVFKDETGKNFIEYLTDIRMKRAAELLRTTDMPSFLIAQKVGYDNINYFGRIFKKETGMSPSHYKETFKISNK